MWDMQPSEFWALCPQEFWWEFDSRVKRGRAETPNSTPFSSAAWEEARRKHSEKMNARANDSSR